jgi:hypothetical protein
MRSICAPLPMIVILAASTLAFGSPTAAPSAVPMEEQTDIRPASVMVSCAQAHPNKRSQAYKLCRCAEMYPTKTSAEYKICKGIIETRGRLSFVAPNRRRVMHVTSKLVKILIEEGKAVLAKPQNRWMTLSTLLGLATAESDLRWWLKLVDRRGADCGITQNRVSEPTVVPKCARRGVYRYGCWMKECRRVSRYSTPRKSIRASFELGMKEMNDIRNKWCCLRGDRNRRCRGRRWKPGVDQLRCIFNVYNQGPRYTLSWRWYYCQVATHKRRRCRYTNRYYVRVLCFAKGYELGRKAKYRCRRAWSYSWIKRAYALPKIRRISRK